MHAGKNGARKPCTANSALGVARSVVFGFARCKKEPQKPHSGSKLTVPEQPLITRPRTLEKPVLTLPPRKQCLQTKLGQREHILVERKGLEQLDRLLVLSPAKAT